MIVAVHPERRSADLVYCDTAMPVGEVQFASFISSDGGSWNVPDVPKPQSDAQQASPPPNGRVLIALVDDAGGRPIIMGFTAPGEHQLRFTEQNREVHRHSSGAYTTIAPDGSIETYHPSGAYFRIGAGGHQNLTDVAVDNSWKEATGGAAPTITLHTGKFNLAVDPDGNVSLTCNGNLAVSAKGTSNIHSDGAMMLSSNGAVTIKGTTVDLNPP